ncbi:Ferric/cupric reductase transmembrane component B [Colletotrichum tropicale]|nr:Ferric/cupric reductase transmembrane component B [Colletotrichum tropicale]
MKLHSFVALAAAAGHAMGAGQGLVGYGITMYKPPCAFACRDAISGATLNCSTTGSDDMDGMSGMSMSGMVMTDPSCYATDDAFLQTLAWCVSTRCKNMPTWKLEKFWQENVAGTEAVQPDPKETYQQALEKIDGTPTALYDATGSLNQTSLVSEGLWFAAYNTDTIFENQESQQEGFGLIILLSGVVIPIAVSLLRFVPFPTAWRTKFNALIIDPPLFGYRHDTPVFFGLALMPKRGQALFILYFIVINTLLSAVNYQYADPNTWYPGDGWRWMCMLISNRLGLLSFANLPLVFLYAGRNNLLLWVTDWSHSTFLLVHRWIAAIATLQAILHSIIYLDVYIKNGTHATESREPYWYWGIIATLGLIVMFPSSVIPIRRKIYEAFLAWHIAVAILIIAGCYWHIVFEFKHQWGYEVWIIVCMAIWAFDRVFRVLRLLRHDVKTADITAVDSEYVRVTVPGVSASGVAYLYFPTLTWRVWENHPFSISSGILSSTRSRIEVGRQIDGDIEKISNSSIQAADKRSAVSHRPVSSSQTSDKPPEMGITFYIRTQTGLSSLLSTRSTIPVLVESGYSSHAPLFESPHKAPTLVAIAGGVGITALLPSLAGHPGRSKLFWGCRSQALVDDIEVSGSLWRVEKEVFIGKRMDVRDVLEGELSATSEVCVMVCGPEGLSDEVRTVFSEIVRKENGAKARLIVESFSW